MTQSDNLFPLFKDFAAAEHHKNVACQECSLFHLCLPLGLHNNDLVKLDKIIKRSQTYERGQGLFSEKSDFKSLYVVRSGSFKTTISADDGRDQVTGFYFPGEFIGLDAIHQEAYQSSATALESSAVCELPFSDLQKLSYEVPQLQEQVLTRLSKELSADKSFMFLLGKKTAEEKLATYLISLSKRFQERGFSATEFQLTMSRGDIANHLGLALETVSRVFSRFQEKGLLTTEGRTLYLRDLNRLKVLCG